MRNIRHIRNIIKELFKKITVGRGVGILALFLFTFIAVIYQKGYFSLSFISEEKTTQSEHTTQKEPSETTGIPDVLPEDYDELDIAHARKYIYELRYASNISKIGLSASEDFPQDELADERPTYPSNNDTIAGGYLLSYGKYDKQNFVIAESVFQDIENRQTFGNKQLLEWRIYQEEEDGERLSRQYTKNAARLLIEPYMGYIIQAGGEKLLIKNINREVLGEFEYGSFTPALTRDTKDRPLFYLNGMYNSFYHFDEKTKEFVPSDYNDITDTRGLYFDYPPYFGKSDNNIMRLSMKKTILVPDPDYIPPDTEQEKGETTIAAYQGSIFSELLPRLLGKNTENKTAVTVRLLTTNDETTADTAGETTPDTTGEITSDTTDETTADTTDETTADTTDETTADTTDETTADTTDETTADTTDETTADTTDETTADTTDETTTDTTDETTTDTTDETTEEPEPVIPMIEIEVYRSAYGYGHHREITGYSFLKLFNFSGGFGAAVDELGRYMLIRTSGYAGITGIKTYFNENGQYVTSSLTEPLLKGAEGLGHYYFDSGLIRVRQIDKDASKNYATKVTGDYDYLIFADGTKFNTPSGFSLVSYSEGILLLEKNGLYGYYHKDGYWIAQPIYSYARPFSEGLGVIGFRGSKKGVVDKSGNVVIPFAYEQISDISSGVITAYRELDGWTILGKYEKK